MGQCMTTADAPKEVKDTNGASAVPSAAQTRRAASGATVTSPQQFRVVHDSEVWLHIA